MSADEARDVDDRRPCLACGRAVVGTRPLKLVAGVCQHCRGRQTAVHLRDLRLARGIALPSDLRRSYRDDRKPCLAEIATWTLRCPECLAVVAGVDNGRAPGPLRCVACRLDLRPPVGWLIRRD